MNNKMDIRHGKISSSNAGGTASKGSKTYRVTIPSSWVSTLKLDGHSPNILLLFDGDRIVISPPVSIDDFKQKRIAKGHRLLCINYYNKETLCTSICADMIDKDLVAVNHVDDLVLTAFGINDIPSWDDLLEFLEERCVPRTRDGIKYYLEYMGLYEYDPLKIVEKTQGRMAEDKQWMEISYL